MTENLLRERIIGLELAPALPAVPLELVIAAWLDAKRSHSASAETANAYTATLAKFRAALALVGLDLAGDERAVALVAQAFAAQGQIAPATHNRRLAILSSFYRFAIRRGLLSPPNPIDTVERRPVQPYAHAHALDYDALRRRLAAIDRTSVAGARDYVLLSVALITGRRLSELAALRIGDVQLGDDAQVTLHWRRCKGGRVLDDALPTGVGQALLAYLRQAHDTDLATLTADAAVWLSCSPRNRGQPIGIQSIADICQRRLGISRVHRLRHTFAHAMDDAGASLTQIQRRLGHTSPATTGLYMVELRRAENTYAEEIARMLGVEG